MDEIKLSDDVIEQIKDFEYGKLTEEQESLTDKLITDKELKERYKNYGLCKKLQLKARHAVYTIEWIEYDKFEDVEYLAKGGFGTTFKAVWKDGCIEDWDENNQLIIRGETKKVALKCLHNSQDITADFLKEVESNVTVYNTGCIVRCFGITKDPKTNNFMIVMELKNGGLRQHLNNNFISLNWDHKLYSLFDIAIGLQDIHDKGLIHQDFHYPLKRPNASELRELIFRLVRDIHLKKVDSVIYGQVKEADEINKKLSFSSPLISTGTISYTTNPQAVYTSRLLDFKNLPEPKNADNNDDLLGIEYSVQSSRLESQKSII
ncbi:uncharacterized protein OCT59_005793 [Rhizophagus irregularis]|uniref:uncharacterized protein n=1 Tax=Rhizophagus irregularis TaxID=588596 RepID=UPI00332B4B06|nr:hypothetical protein OCT59_005793 [Rhizophagus irregularis]